MSRQCVQSKQEMYTEIQEGRTTNANARVYEEEEGGRETARAGAGGGIYEGLRRPSGTGSVGGGQGEGSEMCLSESLSPSAA